MSELAKALHKAQGQIEGAKKDSANPHFKSKYADLTSVWDACREALQANGLSVAQFSRVTEAGAVLVTRLLHVSGESLDGETPLLNSKGDMQGLGSALTYARRYGLAAMVGVCPDDDGNAASETPKLEKPAGYDAWLLDMESAADNGLAAMTAAWKGATEPCRAYYLQTTDEAKRAALRAKATKADAGHE